VRQVVLHRPAFVSGGGQLSLSEPGDQLVQGRPRTLDPLQ
jgi:hypothetical protein